MNEYIFTIDWISGSINSNIIDKLKKNNIKYHYNKFGTLVADLCGDGNYYEFNFQYISGNSYGISAFPAKIS